MLYSIFQLSRKLDLGWHDAFDQIVDGNVPLAPVYVGAFARWRAADADNWVASGCLPGEELDEENYSRLVTALLGELRELDAKGTRL